MAFKAEINVSLGWHWSDGATDGGRLATAQRLTEGNGDNQAEAVWHVENLSLLDGESTTFDLTNLTRLVLGDTLTVSFLSVKALMIVNGSESTGRLLVGGAASDEWSAPFGAAGDQVALPPDGPLMLANRQSGWAVDQTQRHLKLAADDGDATFSIAIIGTITAAVSGSGE